MSNATFLEFLEGPNLLLWEGSTCKIQPVTCITNF